MEDLVRTDMADWEQSGELVRPLRREDVRSLLEELSGDAFSPSHLASIIVRKLKVQPDTFRRQLLGTTVVHPHNGPVTPLPKARTTSTANPEVLDALYAIQNTPYERSFLSRLQGAMPANTPGLIAVDWETQSPWMDLMSDVREHFVLAHPEREQPLENVAPIEYMSLRPSHIDQVHDLLARTFWEGINVSDALEYSPEKCTVIATYKKLVVGAAFVSSPQEAYITYLAVRAGWENAQIATYVEDSFRIPYIDLNNISSTMLYHLITLNPNKDLTLHVSINNPAMLLYNRFGFKAEEFIVGFYEDYLDPQSRASKNAFRLRLRR
ncbi:hypothetical protein B0H21DRAFT_864923, partial [Amylocystis lapponica]